MHEILKEGTIGNFQLKKFTIDGFDFQAMKYGIPLGDYIKLQTPYDIIMSNTSMEKRSNARFVMDAHGDVFIAGLGIGLIILPIQNKEEVNSITILEKYPEVIELVGKQLPLNDKVKIIQGNVFDYEFPKGTKFDCLYFDIWNWVNSDIYKNEMQVLKKKYRRFKRSPKDNPTSFIKCWAEYEAKNDRNLR
jgi:hypothetical protein